VNTTRRLNWTGRRLIRRSEYTATLTRHATDPVELNFSLTLDSATPENTQTILEVSDGFASMRFELGNPASLGQPVVRRLDRIDPGGTPRARIKIVDIMNQPGRIVAASKSFRLLSEDDEGEDTGKCILSTESASDMHNSLWRLEFEEGSNPVLYFNGKLRGFRERLREGGELSALVLPEALRQILYAMRQDPGDDADTDTWQADWRAYCQELGCDDQPVTALDDGDMEEYKEWVRNVVERFCERHGSLSRVQRLLDGVSEP